MNVIKNLYSRIFNCNHLCKSSISIKTRRKIIKPPHYVPPQDSTTSLHYTLPAYHSSFDKTPPISVKKIKR